MTSIHLFPLFFCALSLVIPSFCSFSSPPLALVFINFRHSYRTAWLLKKGLICCPETSVRTHQSTQCKTTEERKPKSQSYNSIFTCSRTWNLFSASWFQSSPSFWLHFSVFHWYRKLFQWSRATGDWKWMFTPQLTRSSGVPWGGLEGSNPPPPEIPKFWQSRTGLQIERKMFSVPIPTSKLV